MATVNGISDLPGIPQPDVDPGGTQLELPDPLLRRLRAGTRHRRRTPGQGQLASAREDADPGGRLRITTSDGGVGGQGRGQRDRHVDAPVLAVLSGCGGPSPLGRQLHYAHYRGPWRSSAGRRVVVVGGGTGASAMLNVLSELPPPAGSPAGRRFPGRSLRPAGQARRVASVEERVRRAAAAERRQGDRPRLDPGRTRRAGPGVLNRRPMFDRIGPDGVGLADGGLSPADMILWATGFRAALDHLAPLHLAGPAAASAWTAPGWPPSRGCNWSATAPRPAPSAPTARAEPP